MSRQRERAKSRQAHQHQHERQQAKTGAVFRDQQHGEKMSGQGSP